MSRTLPASIINALAGTYQLPYFSLTAQDLRQRYTVLANGGTAGRTSAFLSNAGTLIKAICTQNTDPNTVTVARITSPTTASQWTAAGTTISTSAQALAGVCVVQDPGASTNPIRCYYQKTTDHKIYYRDSTDDGVTWSAELAIPTLPGAGLGGNNYFEGIAAHATTSILVATSYYGSINSACWLTRNTYSAGAWQGWTHDTAPYGEGPTTPAVLTYRGLQSIPRAGGQDLIAAGFSYQYPAAGGITMGIGAQLLNYDGTNYGSWVPIQKLDNANLGLSTNYPTINYDSSTATWYFVAHMQNDGSVSGVYTTRTRIYSSTDLVTFTPFLELAQTFQYGAFALKLSGLLYVFDGGSVVIANASVSPTDATPDVLSIALTDALNAESHFAVVLSNESGQYNSHPSIRADASITLATGYGTTGVTVGKYLIDSYTYDSSDVSQQIVLQCRCYLKLLDRPSNRFISYTSQTISQLIQSICAQVGLAVGTLPATAQFGYTVPCFMISQGETWLAALHRLSTIYGFRYWCDETPKLRVIEPQLGDASTWTYGTEAPSISQRRTADQDSYVKVHGIDTSGNAVWGEAIDPVAIETAGFERMRLVVDRTIDTAAKATTRASIELRDEQMAAYTVSLLTAVNPGHELGDVITINDSPTGTTNQKARITELKTVAHPEQGMFETTIHCTAV